jgi:hypothetical protein
VVERKKGTYSRAKVTQVIAMRDFMRPSQPSRPAMDYREEEEDEGLAQVLYEEWRSIGYERGKVKDKWRRNVLEQKPGSTWEQSIA